MFPNVFHMKYLPTHLIFDTVIAIARIFYRVKNHVRMLADVLFQKRDRKIISIE